MRFYTFDFALDYIGTFAGSSTEQFNPMGSGWQLKGDRKHFPVECSIVHCQDARREVGPFLLSLLVMETPAVAD